jgi:hypothetical protein
MIRMYSEKFIVMLFCHCKNIKFTHTIWDDYNVIKKFLAALYGTTIENVVAHWPQQFYATHDCIQFLIIYPNNISCNKNIIFIDMSILITITHYLNTIV